MLERVEPVVVAAYIEQLGRERSAPTVKQALAAIRMLFDWMVMGQVLPINPAASLRGPKHVVKRGKTPVLTAGQARQSAGCHRHVHPRGPARPRAHRRDGLQLPAGVRRRRDARRGLLPHRQTLVAAPARKRRQAPRGDRITTPRRTSTPTSRPPGSGTTHAGRCFARSAATARCRTAGCRGPTCCAWSTVARGAPAWRSTPAATRFARRGSRRTWRTEARSRRSSRLPARVARTTKLYDRTNDELTLDEIERIVI